jgi:Leucine carboxyl methyltransferase
MVLQPLARRWMDLSARWMNGDLALLRRWDSMLREQPGLPLPGGMDRALLDYIDQATGLRLAALAKYIGADGLQHLDKTLEPEWGALSERAERLMAAGAPPHSASARQLARDWQALPGTQRCKQELLTKAGIGVPASLKFVPMDFEHDDLGGALRTAGFRAEQAACVSWMGVTMYLTADSVLATLRTVAGFAAGSCLCFDYRVPATMLDPVERVINGVIERQVAALGEPWLSNFDPTQLQGELLKLGFRCAESASPDDLNARYFARRKDGLRTGEGVHIMCTNT